MLKKLLLITGVALIVSAGFVVWKFQTPQAPRYAFITVHPQTLRQEVQVTGTVKAKKNLTLSFPEGGTIAHLYVDEGQRVTRGDLLAELDTAALLIAKKNAVSQRNLRRAELAKLTTPPSFLKGAPSLSVEQAYVALYNALNSLFLALTTAKNAMGTIRKDDLLFVSLLHNNADLRAAYSNLSLGDVTDAYFAAQQDLTIDNIMSFLARSEEAFPPAMEALLLFDKALSSSSPGNSVTRSQIDTAITSIRSSKEKLQSAYASVMDTKAVLFTKLQNLQSDIEIAKSRLAAAEASLEDVEKKLNDARLTAPLSGIVTTIVKKEGEEVAPREPVLHMESTHLVIEANIPEVDIANVAIGNSAQVTLDAFGDDVVFQATVEEIDPFATIVEGVPTYTTTLVFIPPLPKPAKPGMTANITILSREKQHVLAVPQRAIITSGATKQVRILGDEGKIRFVPVVTGLQGSDGNVEIVQGLHEGDRVITFIPER
ncbi:efflux RND transporter periplasmic adaptor subunit [Candidatus Parcubacteria bacterium]|nr:MAG: efflux RND transporter periplasmic adaptor subunit [Candidatus Parcubacteria bacterium]